MKIMNICDNFMIYLALKAKKDYTLDYMMPDCHICNGV